MNISEIEPGDKVALVRTGTWPGKSIRILTLKRSTKTTAIFTDTKNEDHTYSLDKYGEIGDERGQGRRSTWDPRPTFAPVDSDLVTETRKQIQAEKIERSAGSLAQQFTQRPSRETAKAAMHALAEYVAHLDTEAGR